jgi:hypothetical protein
MESAPRVEVCSSRKNSHHDSSLGWTWSRGVPITAHGSGTFDDATVDLVNDCRDEPAVLVTRRQASAGEDDAYLLSSTVDGRARPPWWGSSVVGVINSSSCLIEKPLMQFATIPPPVALIQRALIRKILGQVVGHGHFLTGDRFQPNVVSPALNVPRIAAPSSFYRLRPLTSAPCQRRGLLRRRIARVSSVVTRSKWTLNLWTPAVCHRRFNLPYYSRLVSARQPNAR